ncbi:MAG: flagellar hook-basal body complex protein, partial [Oscillospiraceae bacterium]|nr:flagellar hook-basal body complex protein [Oscillospiraceae bacterium]
MTGAMYAAIAGLKTHMNKLNVIGNNIANVNTYGYKTQRAIFSDSIYTSLRAGSNGTAVDGAINPSQIGYGVELTSVDIDMSSGTFAPTGKDMDCMIMGDGFFLVGDKEKQFVIDPANPQSLASLSLTRVGNFDFKADGYLSDANGNLVYGFLCTGVVGETTTFSDQLVPIKLPRLNATTDENGITKFEIAYPSATEGGYLEEATAEDGSTLPFAGMDSIAIDPATGLITGTSKDSEMPITIGVIAMGNVTNP